MKIDLNKIPNHVAIILDGNGRWAKKRFLPRVMGHKEGAKNIAKVAKHASSLGISHLTVFCFSTENWNRPQDEVNFLMNLPMDFYKQYKDKILDSNIKIKVIGRRDRLNSELVNLINEIENETSKNTELVLTLCLDYGSYDEITTAVKNISRLVLEQCDFKVNLPMGGHVNSLNVSNATAILLYQILVGGLKV